MKNLRRPFTEIQFKKASEAYGKIFRGLYYRHEFARRNETVTDDSAKLAKALGFKPDRFQSFKANGRYLTDEIMTLVAKPINGKKGDLLSTYLKQHSVLPVNAIGENATPFFDRNLFETPQVVFDECFNIFKSLMVFEAYALAKLGVGHPVMFPVMPLKVVGQNKTVIVDKLDLSGYQAPMFLDFSVPSYLFEAYCEAITLDMQVNQFHRTGKLGFMNSRNRIAALDDHLKIIDYSRSLSDYGTKGIKKIEFAEKIQKKVVRSAEQRDKAIKAFDEILADALKHLDEYRELI